jgi:hypothetical protein
MHALDLLDRFIIDKTREKLKDDLYRLKNSSICDIHSKNIDNEVTFLDTSSQYVFISNISRICQNMDNYGIPRVSQLWNIENLKKTADIYKQLKQLLDDISRLREQGKKITFSLLEKRISLFTNNIVISDIDLGRFRIDLSLEDLTFSFKALSPIPSYIKFVHQKTGPIHPFYYKYSNYDFFLRKWDPQGGITSLFLLAEKTLKDEEGCFSEYMENWTHIRCYICSRKMEPKPEHKCSLCDRAICPEHSNVRDGKYYCLSCP